MSTTHVMADEMLKLVRLKTPYLALLRSVPDKSGMGGNEITESSYARQLVIFADPDQSAMTNSERVDFSTALTDWGTVLAYALFDAQSGGAMLWFGPLDSPTPIPIGSHFFVPPEGLVISVGLS